MSAGARAELAAQLAHDVGKYVARTARNLPPGPPPAPLVRMLVRDLYALPGDRRASSVLDALAAPLEAIAPDERIRRARALLAEIDAAEAAVRAGEPAAVARAAAQALEVEALLRAVAADARADR